LRHVQAAYAIKNEKKYYFQIVAYQKAADAIENATSQIADLVKENKLDHLPGIGVSIKSHLEELVKNGRVKHFDAVLKGVPPAVFPLLEIPGFGPKKAYKLVTAFSLKNPDTIVKDIEKKALEGKITPLEGFGEKSQEDILQRIQQHKKGETKTNRMLLPFAEELAEKVLTYLKRSPNVSQAFPLGSLRRKKPTIGDLDFAVATNNQEKVLEYFINYPYRQRIIEKGPATSSILISGGYQIDLMTQPVKSFGSLLQHFTGSKAHNVHLRDYALKKKLSLSEYGIKRLEGKDKSAVKSYETEESFYRALGMDWIPPELREDTGEIEKAISRSLPNLVELSDIKGDLHVHSSYPIEPSHDLGANTMKDMLKRAQELHYEYLGFSEHNPSVSQHSKDEIYSILAKRNEYIEQLKESNKNIRIINLLEIDILPNGNLAIDEKSLDTIDAAIVSIHSSFSMDTKTMTKRVLQGLSQKKAKILAHPTGRMLNNRTGYTLDWESVFAFCKEQKKALEINSWPERTDLPDILIKQAVTNSVKMIINTDSHAVSHMDVMRYGLWNARRGWAEKRDIINTLKYHEFVEWLKS